MKYCILLFMFVSVTGFAQNKDSLFISKISKTVMNSNETYENLRYLTKKIGNRISGSENYKKAEEWGFQTLEKLGSDTVWKLPCWVPNWKRGESKIIFQGKELKSLSIGNAVGTEGKKITANLLLINDFKDLKIKSKEIKDKIVFYDYHFSQENIHTFLSYRDAVQYRSKGADSASFYGAKAIITRSSSSSLDEFPHTGALYYSQTVPKIPALTPMSLS